MVSALKQRLYQSKLASDLGKLLIRQLGIKAISFFATSYALSRLGADGLGKTAYPMVVVNACVLLIGLGFDTNLPKWMAQAGSISDRVKVAKDCYSLRLTLVFCCLPVFGLLYFCQPGVFGSGAAQQLALWTAAYAFLVGTMMNPLPASQGLDQLETYGNAQVMSSLGGAMLFICLMPIIGSPATYLGIQAISLLITAWIVFRKKEFRIRLSPTFSSLGELPEHLRKGWPVMCNTAVLFALYTSDGVFLAHNAGTAQNGMFILALTVCNSVNAFLSMVPTAIYPRLLSWYGTSAGAAVSRTIGLTGIIALSTPVLFLGALWGFRLLGARLFGPSFEGTAVIFANLVSVYWVVVAGTVLSWIMLLAGKSRRLLSINIGWAVVALLIYSYTSQISVLAMTSSKLGLMILVTIHLVYEVNKIKQFNNSGSSSDAK